MKRTYTTILTMVVVALLASAQAFAQSNGDFRAAADGDWSATSTWETFDGSDWQDASDAPDGSEDITISAGNTVTVDGSITITGTVAVQDTSSLEIGDGDLTVGDGGTYDHARDGGDIPDATWETGSTAIISGTVNSAPGNRGQDYHHLILDTPDKNSNLHMSLDGNTVSGDITVVSTGSSRWYLMSVSTGESGTVEISGDVNVEDGEFSVQGTGNAETTFIVNHSGDINVTGGNFSIARGSQGSGSGTTTWNLEGDFNMADAESQNSNPEGAKFVFAANGTQVVNFSNVDFGSRVNYDVSENTTLEIADGTGFVVSGVLANYGEITTTGDLTIDGGGTYEHARDGGDVPDATWEEGSTALFTGVEGSAPGNRNQEYHHLTFDTPNLSSNLNMNYNGETIHGNVTVLSTSSGNRWQFFGGSSASVTVMGDLIVEDGNFTVQGTGTGDTEFVVNHYGNVRTNGGNFSIARGSQGGSGTTTWNFFGDSFSVDSTRMQSSNSDGAKWVFAKNGTSTISLVDTDYDGSALQMEISDSTTLDLGEFEIGSGGDVTLFGNLATSHEDGIDGNLQTSGEITFDEDAGFVYNGTAAQVLGEMVFDADSVGSITVSNAEGVSINDTLYVTAFNVSDGAEAHIDTAGSVSTGGGSIDGNLVNQGAVEVDDDASLAFGADATYEHARDGGDVPTGSWGEGSTILITGTIDDAPGNSNQSYYNLTFNTPDLRSNEDMGFNDVTIEGDIHIVSTGSARWYLTTASTEESASVTIMGDITHDNGSFSVQGSGNAETTFEVHHYGSATVNDGNFSVSRGSQGNGSGTTNWYFYEGDLNLNGGKAQNSNPDSANWVFAGSEDVVHQLNLSSEFEIEGSGLQIVVDDNASLDLGESEITSGGDFTTGEGSTLLTSHVDGLDGNLQNTGDLSLSSEGNYTFNGTEEQETSFSLPLVVHGLTIDNEAGVIQSRDITINGFLRLSAGVFDNTIGLTLGENAEIIIEDGSLLIPLEGDFEIPEPPYAIGDTLNYNGSFSTADVGATEADAWLIEGADNSSWEIVDDAADEDNRALEFTVSHSGSDWHSSQAVNEPINVVEGESYNASAYLKADEDGRLVRFYAGMPESGGWERVRGWDTPQLELTTEWEKYEFEFIATEDHETNTLRLAFEYNIDTNDGGVIYIDDVVLEKIESVSNEITDAIPSEFDLKQNYPNPFNPTTKIEYDVPEQAHVTIKVYDITGREVAELVNNRHTAGVYTQEWDASNFASGMYIYRITAGDFTAVRKLTLIK